MLELAKKSKSSLLLFYPTSPVHIRDMRLLTEKLPEWRFEAILYEPLTRVAPGIADALRQHGIGSITVNSPETLPVLLPEDARTLMLGAVFEPFALDLMAWGKHRRIPVIAIEEVAQLALNQRDINNYDAPFDRLFVASSEEFRLFRELGYPSEMLRVSGLLANDRFDSGLAPVSPEILTKLGITTDEKPIVYTTSAVRTRLSLHNKDDIAFRAALLKQLARAARSTRRKVIIKLHPNENLESNRNLIKKIIPDAIVVGREMGMDQLFPATAVLVNRGNSQTCLEATLRGIPTVVAACGLKTVFHSDGGAYVVEELSQIEPVILKALANPPPDTSRVRDKHFAASVSGVADFIAQEIRSVAVEPRPTLNSSWNWIIRSMLFIGRHDQALALSQSLDSDCQWRTQVQEALQAHAVGKLRDAVDAWRRCADLEPHWYFSHYELAHKFLALGQPERALAHSQKANQLHPPFHKLWHELPMEVVAMTALRRMGRRKEAQERLRTLQDRGLVEIVPELLIEAAAQQDMTKLGNCDAEKCLEQAVRQLKNYPVDKTSDDQIMRRAIWQYFNIAKRRAELDEEKEIPLSLRRAMDLVEDDVILRDQSLGRLVELAENSNRRAHYSFARHCYALASHSSPANPWVRFLLARLEARLRRYGQALRQLHSITRTPEETREVTERILSPRAKAWLVGCWPNSPKTIIKPIKLLIFAFSWLMRRAMSRAGSVREGTFLLLLISVYVARHFIRRLRTETAKIRKLWCKAQSAACAFAPIARATNCPICGGSGTFEYRNKLTPLLRCRSCKHVYARDLPDDRALMELYDDFSYWERDKFHQGITTIEESEQWRSYLNARMDILQKLRLLESAESNKRIFEIGCSEGMLLHEMTKHGFEVAGCEMNRAVAAQGASSFGVKIFTEPFEVLDLAPEEFDLVISFHTLEHMRNPVAVLAKAAGILRPEGAILIEVPCGEEEYENTDHLHFFSEKSLKLLLQRYFVKAEILPNRYVNTAGVQIGSIYGVGRAIRKRRVPIPQS